MSGLLWFPLCTVYPKKYAQGFVVLCFVVVMQSFIMNSHEVFIHIHQGCFAGTGAIVRLPQCQWSKSDGYGKISQCITTTKHSKAVTVCIFLGLYCTSYCIVSITKWFVVIRLIRRFPGCLWVSWWNCWGFWLKLFTNDATKLEPWRRGGINFAYTFNLSALPNYKLHVLPISRVFESEWNS